MSSVPGMTQQLTIAFLGLGAMGRRMAARLIAAGHDVVVWNRSRVPADSPALDARSVASPAQAVQRADLVFAMVRDDEASREVWLAPGRGALAAMRAQAIAVECSTLTPAWTAELAGTARRSGLEFIDAPVVGSRPQAEAGALVVLAGGTAAALDRARPALASLASAVHHVGPTPAGAAAKLLVNALFGVQVAALAELLGFARGAGLDLAALMSVLEGLPVLSGSARAAAAGMLAQRYEPMFPVELVAKDLRYALAASAAAGGRLPVIGRTREVFEQAAVGGLGGENLTAIAKLYT